MVGRQPTTSNQANVRCFVFSHNLERPGWYLELRRFPTKPSAPIAAVAPLPSSSGPGEQYSGLGKSGGAGMARCPLQQVMAWGGVAASTVGATTSDRNMFDRWFVRWMTASAPVDGLP